MFPNAILLQEKYDLSVFRPTRPHLSYRYTNLKKFYETKIVFLQNQKNSDALIKLICRDAPFEPADLGSWWGRKRFISKCIKYYRAQLREIEKIERGGWFRFLTGKG